jgi:hypothetical protein
MNNLGISENIRLKKRGRKEYTISLRGRLETRVVDRTTGKVKHYQNTWNDLQAGAIEYFVRAITNPAAEKADAPVVILGSKTFEIADLTVFGATPSNSPGAALGWEFTDNTNDSFSWSHMDFWTGETLAPESIHFSRVTHTTAEPPGNLTGPLSKGVNDILTGTFYLELYASASSGITPQGMSHLLALFINNVTPGEAHITSSTQRLRPANNSGTEIGDTDIPPRASGGFTVDEIEGSITMIFDVGTSENNVTWDWSKLKNTQATNNPLRNGWCRQNGTSCGTKSSDETWEYTYVINFAQGT